MAKMTITANDGRSLGQVGYDAYADSTGGKTYDGRDMPKWHDLPERIRDAWNEAANAIAREHTKLIRHTPPR